MNFPDWQDARGFHAAAERTRGMYLMADIRGLYRRFTGVQRVAVMSESAFAWMREQLVGTPVAAGNAWCGLPVRKSPILGDELTMYIIDEPLLRTLSDKTIGGPGWWHRG